MVEKKEVRVASTDGKNNLYVAVWECDNPRMILQISHGMVEHIDRYDDFARFLTDKGILVIGNDHLGHGYTAKEGDHGYFGDGLSATVVDDLHEVTKYAKETYGENIPYFLLGHSMGSFMARRYLMTYGDELAGAIISGTGMQPGIVIGFGKLVTSILSKTKGDRYISDFVENTSFGSYNKRIKNLRTKSDWLSRDEENVDKYIANKFCQFRFTINGFRTLMDVLSFIQKKTNVNKIPKKLPIFFIAGEEDPVGNYGKGVRKVFASYQGAGIEDVSIKMYPEDRHEILNEIDKDVVYADVLAWIERVYNG